MEDSTTAAELDRIDRQLLAELQADGRLSIAELARRVHLSPTPCFERVKRLERGGFIRDYVARLNAERIGFPVLAFVEVALEKTNPEIFEQFRHLIQELDEVLECYMTAGDFDYLLKVRTTSMTTFRQFLGDRLTAVPGLKHTHTYFALEETKVVASLPIREPRIAGRQRVRGRASSPR